MKFLIFQNADPQLAHQLFHAVRGKETSPDWTIDFDQSESANVIRLAATHGPPGSIRYVCSKFVTELRQGRFGFEKCKILM